MLKLYQSKKTHTQKIENIFIMMELRYLKSKHINLFNKKKDRQCINFFVQLNICFTFININVSAVVNKYFCGKQNSFHRQKFLHLIC